MSLSKPNNTESFQMNINKIPAVNFVEGKLPPEFMNELNSYIDEHRGKMNDYSDHLVGQIKQNEKSQQLELEKEAPTVTGLINILGMAGRVLISSYSDQLIIDKNAYNNLPLDCFSIWTVHSYDGDYNPMHDHDVSYDQKSMSFSCILYCKVPPQIEELTVDGSNDLYESGGNIDGCTQFVWGTNTSADYLTLRPRQDRVVKPEVGKFMIFPCWLKHSVMPFYGEGERRTLSANFRAPFKISAKERSDGKTHDHWENFEKRNKK